MDVNEAIGWWIVCGVLVAAELATGTFFLLMLALGAAAAALGAHVGLGFNAQLVLGAAVGGGAVLAWHFKRSREPAPPPASTNRDVNLDIGERVHVERWNADGTARITYRGASWSVRYQGSGVPAAGEYVIRGVDGNKLLLDR